jgi:predicted RNA methylase
MKSFFSSQTKIELDREFKTNGFFFVRVSGLVRIREFIQTIRTKQKLTAVDCSSPMGKLPSYLFAGLGQTHMAMDSVGLFSVTDRHSADQLTALVSEYLTRFKSIPDHKAVITDACACVGGNTLSFAKRFGTVNAFELDPIRYNMLIHNLTISGCLTNVIARCDDFVGLNNSSHVIFIDPPWGGPDYHTHKDLDLFLSNVNIVQVVSSLISPETLIVMKVPTNFNFDGFARQVTDDDDEKKKDRLIWTLPASKWTYVWVGHSEDLRFVQTMKEAQTWHSGKWVIPPSPKRRSRSPIENKKHTKKIRVKSPSPPNQQQLTNHKNSYYLSLTK